MAKLPLFDVTGNRTGEFDVDETQFPTPNPRFLHQIVIAYELNKRQGTHKAKTRGEVSGGGKKPWPQKHTGRARQGSIRAPQWRHGGKAFGPVPREYRRKISTKQSRVAFLQSLAGKIKDNQLAVIESLDEKQFVQDGKPKTKLFNKILKTTKLGTPLLVVDEKYSKNAIMAARNLPNASMTYLGEVNAYQVLKARDVLITKPALAKIQGLLKKKPVEAATGGKQ